MERKKNKNLVANARALRREMTPQERHLWYDFLRDYPVRFRRQKVLGRYIADFYCAQAKLILELDGSQHYEDTGPEADAARTRFFQQYDLEVLRIPNNEIAENFDGVCEAIGLRVQEKIK